MRNLAHKAELERLGDLQKALDLENEHAVMLDRASIELSSRTRRGDKAAWEGKLAWLRMLRMPGRIFYYDQLEEMAKVAEEKSSGTSGFELRGSLLWSCILISAGALMACAFVAYYTLGR